MQFSTLGELFSHPSFLLLFLTILLVIANVIVGVSILPEDQRRKGYKLHRYVYYAIVIFLVVFLVVNHSLIGNAWGEYLTFAFFASVIPLSRKMNVTLHAIVSSVGLVLLMLLAVFRIL